MKSPFKKSVYLDMCTRPRILACISSIVCFNKLRVQKKFLGLYRVPTKFKKKVQATKIQISIN